MANLGRDFRRVLVPLNFCLRSLSQSPSMQKTPPDLRCFLVMVVPLVSGSLKVERPDDTESELIKRSFRRCFEIA